MKNAFGWGLIIIVLLAIGMIMIVSNLSAQGYTDGVAPEIDLAEVEDTLGKTCAEAWLLRFAVVGVAAFGIRKVVGIPV